MQLDIVYLNDPDQLEIFINNCYSCTEFGRQNMYACQEKGTDSFIYFASCVLWLSYLAICKNSSVSNFKYYMLFGMDLVKLDYPGA